MAESLDLAALNSSLGSYARDNKEQLFLGIMNGDALTANRFLVPMDAKDQVPLPRLDIDEIVKPRIDENFSASNSSLNFAARILQVRKTKIDLKIIPDTMRASYLQQIYNGTIKPNEIPFEQFILDSIIAAGNRDVAEKVLFKGVYNAAGTTAVASFDGYSTIAAADVASGYKNVSGVVDATNVIDTFDATFDLLHSRQQIAGNVKAYCAPELVKMYARAVRDTFNTNISDTIDGKKRWFIFDSDVEIVPEVGMAGTQTIIMTDTDNMVIGTDNKLDTSSINIQAFDRYLKVMVDFEMGVQFREVTNGRVAMNVVS